MWGYTSEWGDVPCGKPTMNADYFPNAKPLVFHILVHPSLTKNMGISWDDQNDIQLESEISGILQVFFMGNEDLTHVWKYWKFGVVKKYQAWGAAKFQINKRSASSKALSILVQSTQGTNRLVNSISGPIHFNTVAQFGWEILANALRCRSRSIYVDIEICNQHQST